MAVTFNSTNPMILATASPVSVQRSVLAGGTNKVAVAVFAFDQATSGGLSIPSVAYGGQQMSSVGAAALNSTVHAYVQAWYLVNPPTGGANLLSFSMTGTITDIYYNLVSFNGVDQTTPIRAGSFKSSVLTTDGTSKMSMTISSDPTDLTVALCDTGGAAIAGTFSNQTSDGFNSGGAYGGGSDHATTGAATVTHTYTLGTANQQAVMAGFSLQAAAAASNSAPGNTTQFLMLSGLGT